MGRACISNIPLGSFFGLRSGKLRAGGLFFWVGGLGRRRLAARWIPLRCSLATSREAVAPGPLVLDGDQGSCATSASDQLAGRNLAIRLRRADIVALAKLCDRHRAFAIAHF